MNMLPSLKILNRAFISVPDGQLLRGAAMTLHMHKQTAVSLEKHNLVWGRETPVVEVDHN